MGELDDFLKWLEQYNGQGQKTGLLGGIDPQKMLAAGGMMAGAFQRPQASQGAPVQGIFGGGQYQPFSRPNLTEKEIQEMIMKQLMKGYPGA